MNLRHIQVKNFLGHKSEALALPAEGMFFLSGPSGGGKSSFIVDAVAYGLYGSRATRAARQDELRHNNADGEEMSVSITFDLDATERFTVERGLDSTGSPFARVFAPSADGSGSVLLAETSSKVNRFIRQKLGGMTWQQFYAAFVARQSEISALTEMRGKDRRDTIHRMLGMRELEKAEEDLNGRLSKERSKLRAAEAAAGDKTMLDFDRDVEAANKEVAEAQDALNQVAETLSLGTKRLLEIESEIAPLSEAKKARDSHAELSASVLANQPILEDLETRLEAQRAHEALARTSDALRISVQEAEDNVERLRTAYKLSKERVLLNEQLNGWKSELAEAEAFIANGQSSENPQKLREEKSGHVATIAAKTTELENRRSDLQQMRDSGTCMTCMRPLDASDDGSHTHSFSSLEQWIGALEKELSAANDEVVKIDKLLPEAQEQEAAIKSKNETITVLRTKITQAENRIDEIDKKIGDSDFDSIKKEGKAAGEKLAQLKDQLDNANAAARSIDSSIESRIEEIRKKISDAQEKLDRETERAFTISNQNRLSELELEHSQLKNEVNIASGREGDVRRRVASAEAALQNAQKAKQAFENTNEVLTETRNSVLVHEQLRDYLQGFTSKLASDIRPSLEQMGTEMLATISGGKHVAMRIDEDYEIEIEHEDGTWLAAKLLSGGESIRVNICLRLALTRLVSQRTGVPIRFLVMDEPLPSQDPDHVSRIMDLLTSLRPWYPQQFVISHVGDLRKSSELDYVMEFNGDPEANDRITLSHA